MNNFSNAESAAAVPDSPRTPTKNARSSHDAFGSSSSQNGANPADTSENTMAENSAEENRPAKMFKANNTTEGEG